MPLPRAALDAIGQMSDSEIDVAGAALQLARVDAPEADWEAAREQLSKLARGTVAFASRLRTPTDLAARADALAELIADRHGYAGDTETYDDLANANLIHVIERRKGLPVTLGILWLHCAHAAGWEAHGIDFPGHFLVALTDRGAQTVIDVFAGGGTLDSQQLRVLLKSVEGESAELRPGLLRPMNTRDVLLRLQQNIKVRRLRNGDLAEALVGIEDMLRIAPEHAALWRESASLNQRLDHVAAALHCLERFLALVPKGDEAARARAAMDELRTRLN